MKTESKLYIFLVISIPLFFGFSMVSSPDIEKINSLVDTIHIPQKGTVYLYRVGSAVGAVVKFQIKVNGQDADGIGHNILLSG